jgi:hypothetical protein
MSKQVEAEREEAEAVAEREEAERKVEAVVAEAVAEAVAEDADPNAFWRKTHDAIEEYVSKLRLEAGKGRRIAPANEAFWRFVRRLPEVLDIMASLTPEQVRSFRTRNPGIAGPVAGAGALIQEGLNRAELDSWLVTAPEIKYTIFIEALQKQPDWKELEGGAK